MRHFYGTESEIWADFGLVGSTENCPTYCPLATFEGNFLCFYRQKKYLKKNLKGPHTKTLHRRKVKKSDLCIMTLLIRKHTWHFSDRFQCFMRKGLRSVLTYFTLTYIRV